MSHLIITSSTTDIMIAILMTTTSNIVAPAATGRADKPALKTKCYLYTYA